MTKKVTKAIEEEKDRTPIVEGLRKVLLASVGAVALAQDEAEDFINKLVERGEIAEKDAKKLAREMMDKRKKQAQEAEGDLDERVQKLLDRMNVPTKADIKALGDKIAALSQKVDDLKKNA